MALYKNNQYGITEEQLSGLGGTFLNQPDNINNWVNEQAPLLKTADQMLKAGEITNTDNWSTGKYGVAYSENQAKRTALTNLLNDYYSEQIRKPQIESGNALRLQRATAEAAKGTPGAAEALAVIQNPMTQKGIDITNPEVQKIYDVNTGERKPTESVVTPTGTLTPEGALRSGALTQQQIDIQQAGGTNNMDANDQPIKAGSVDANGKPIESNGLAGNTLDQIQASPIPEFPAEYGVGSGLSRVDWALQHRQNIFNAYQKYGITPTAEEVNWQLQHNPDINSIEQSIAQAVSSGADTRGKMPAGDKATTDATAKADATITNITSTDANGQDKPLSQVVQEFTDALGLKDISAQIQAVTDAEGEAEMAINENPWFSEAERSKRVQLSAAKFEAKKNALIDRLKLEEDAVARAVDYYEKDREYKKEILFKQLDQQNKDLDRELALEKEARATSTSFQNIGGIETMITYDSQGNVISKTELGKSGSGGGGGVGTVGDTGLSPNAFNQAKNQFNVDLEMFQKRINDGEGIDDITDELYSKYGAKLGLSWDEIKSQLTEPVQDQGGEGSWYNDTSWWADKWNSIF